MSDETSAEEDAALDDAIPHDFQLETAEDEAADAKAERQGAVDVGESDIIAKARARLYGDIDTMAQKDVLAIYVAGSRLEEARLRAVLRKKGPSDEGAADLVKKAGAAIRAARGGSDEE